MVTDQFVLLHLKFTTIWSACGGSGATQHVTLIDTTPSGVALLS